MPLRTSFFNKGIFIDDLKRFSWIGILYTLALVFIVPLHILMIHGQEEPNYTLLKDLFYPGNGDELSIFVLAFAIFTGIFIFRYMQVKATSDMMHSLPVKRQVLYRTHILTGLVLLTLPVFITALLSWILNGALGLGSYYGFQDIVQWAGFIILMELLIFLVCVFVGTLVGMSVVQGVITVIFLFLPLGLTVLFTTALDTFLYGFTFNIALQEAALSPVVRLIEGFKDHMSSAEVITDILLCLVLYFVSEFLYRKRKMEVASQTIGFQQFRWIFKYGVTLCAMLVAGFYFKHSQQHIGWILFGYLAGSLLGYFSAEMILKKSFWVFKNIKGYLIYAVVAMVLLLGLQVDLVGYEKKLPDVSEIESVAFGSGFYELRNGQNVYVEQKDIANIQGLHRQLVADRSENKYGDKKSTEQMVFVYQLKDGSQLTRGYSVAHDRYAQYLKPICESMEYKKFQYEVFKVDSPDVEKITIRPAYSRQDKKAVILDPEEINEAIEVLRQDIEDETYEQMTDNKVPWASIHLSIANDKLKKYLDLYPDMDRERTEISFGASWKKSYVRFEAWLEQKGYLDKARILPEEIDYVVVEKIEDFQQWEEKRRNGEWINEKSTKRLEIRDKSQVEECLRSQTDVWGENRNRRYIIGFYAEGYGNIGYGSFNEEQVPSFIKERL
ncbi:DUF6449 domain-containing protein [Desulforamulus ruminis]|uniref:DUF6449 domain-containing protein n=1 Tax=Desulforamulus ruminis (strain ATCC 23193 / DSM 2154 / NCIMB 8452 / DL) TaxID=696281 RepID=F6DQP7_DESRL|nr:DUF6449 domain-containing protein [Desulforamulus ruminis]AEG62044.1 hypothetical protein Desru_3844 [Desulforamulus ruminis DSM 2154]